MTVNQQYKILITRLRTRKRNPAKPATIEAYNSIYGTWIQPEIGAAAIETVENGTLKRLVAAMAAAGKSPSSIASMMQVVKSIVSSAIDENGNEMLPRKWNMDFVDAPEILPKFQKTPTIDAKRLSAVISAAPSQYGPFLALLAGTGLRVSEALAIKVGPNPLSTYWDPERAIVSVRTQLYQGKEQGPKTAAGVREVDLDPELNKFLVSCECKFIVGELMFTDEEKKPLTLGKVYNAMTPFRIPGFHSFRRFRMTHLENCGVPRGLMDFWMGHAGKDVHDRYVKLNKDIEARKDWAAKAGLGFVLPNTENRS